MGFRPITQKILQQPITKISLKITYQKCHSNLPGTNELMSMTRWRHWTHWQYRGEWVISVPISVTIFPIRLHCPHRRRLLSTWRWSKSIHPNVRPFQEVSGHILENAWKEWLAIRYAGVSWSPSVMIRFFWSWSVDFPNFGATLTGRNGHFFSGIIWRTHGRNGLKLGMLMYLDHPH